MAASREVYYKKDFSGGLNLSEQQQFLAENETPDCLNVDFGNRGGFTVRGGFQAQRNDAEAITDDLGNVLTDESGDPILESGTGVWFIPQGILGPVQFDAHVVLFVDTAGNLIEWDGSTATDTTETLTDNVDAVIQMAVFNEKAYFANCRDTGDIVMFSWDGSTLDSLTPGFNDTETPAGGETQLARLVASHKNHLFLADTVESATRFPHRVRFSYVGEPEDFRTADFFDVDVSDDSDPITALVPFREILLIFKRNSLWALHGNDRDDWVLDRISNATGTASFKHVDANSGVCYWLDCQGKLMAFDGRSVAFIGQKIWWWVDKGVLDAAGAHRVMWDGDRLWISMDAESGAGFQRTMFVWDPSLKAFTRYGFQASDMVVWNRVGQEADLLFTRLIDPNIYRFDTRYTVDKYSTDGSTRIDAYYRTSWITADETATRKRWKRPRLTAAAEDSCTIRVNVYRDFDEFTSTRQQDMAIVSPSGSVWGTAVWGVDEWYDGRDENYEFERLGSSGTAYAIQYRFSSPDSTTRWWVDSIAVPFRRKQVR